MKQAEWESLEWESLEWESMLLVLMVIQMQKRASSSRDALEFLVKLELEREMEKRERCDP